MSTNKISLIKAEIERLFDETENHSKDFKNGSRHVLLMMKDFINSLPEEPVSEDLEEAAKEHAVERFRTTRDEFLAEKCKWSFKAGAQWQEEKDNEEKVLIYKHVFDDCKEQMMKDAIEVTVEMDAGGYPYIHKTIELYDYDKDEPMAKKGDKVKVIIIKEE